MHRDRVALRMLQRALASATMPAVMASFGKDSCAVIDLAAQLGVRRVLYIEDDDEVLDDVHRAIMIDRYQLDVIRVSKGRAVLYFVDGAPYLVAFPFVNRHVMLPVPTNVDTLEPGRPFTCVDARLRSHHGLALPHDIDTLILGFKRADWIDNTCRIALDGRAQTYAPVMPLLHDTRAVFPLLDWSHDDVWDYLDAHHVPVSPRMYAGRVKRPHTNPVCYRCHDPAGPSTVACPLTAEPMMNLAHFTHADGLDALRAFGLAPVETPPPAV